MSQVTQVDGKRWYVKHIHSCGVRPVDYDSFARLINIVFQAEECSNAMYKHAVIWRHLRKLVSLLATITSSSSSSSYICIKTSGQTATWHDREWPLHSYACNNPYRAFGLEVTIVKVCRLINQSFVVTAGDYSQSTNSVAYYTVQGNNKLLCCLTNALKQRNFSESNLRDG